MNELITLRECGVSGVGNDPGPLNAMGVMEFYSVASAVIAVDLAAKAADVCLMDVRLGMGIGGKSFVTLSGEVAVVQAAVDAGCLPAKTKGCLVSTCVIPSPRSEILNSMV